MAYGLASQKSALNICFFALKTCSDRRYFGLDFISHAEGNDAGDAQERRKEMKKREGRMKE